MHLAQPRRNPVDSFCRPNGGRQEVMMFLFEAHCRASKERPTRIVV